MTFIASVIAKKGVAIIADSLVTMSRPVMEADDFRHYVQSKTSPDGKVTQLNPDDLLKLFHKKPSHTKDYEEKLFQYDKYTAITVAGRAVINNRRIGEVIHEISDKLRKARMLNKPIANKIIDFCSELEVIAKSHLAKYKFIGLTTFIVTHYDKRAEKTSIFRVNINNASEANLQNPSFKLVEFSESFAIENVVCDGQNGISERILLGGIDVILATAEKLIDRIDTDYGLKLKPTYKKQLTDEIFQQFQSELKIAKLKGLSLQQAVDLAYLLMKIEIDFQKYTEDMPTVGGVIKIAVIDSEGVRFIAGKEIIDPREHL